MTVLSAIDARRPTELGAALALLADTEGEPWRPLAGGTDLLVEAQHGRSAHSRFLDLSGLRGELGALTWDAPAAGALTIGALVTYAELLRDPRVVAELPILAAMARLVGAAQIQARGTPAGNVENGSPAADVAPVLLALDASVRLASAAGEREVPLRAYWTGYRQSVRRRDELITAIVIPARSFGPNAQWARKVGTRSWQAITKVGLCAVLDWRGGRIAEARLVPVSMSAFPRRLPLLEAALVGADPDAPGFAAQLRAVQAQELQPLDDIRSTATYRGRVFGNILLQAVAETRRAAG